MKLCGEELELLASIGVAEQLSLAKAAALPEQALARRQRASPPLT
jgi:hypothetical protein